jgi:excisionase family DNA binding protein
MIENKNELEHYSVKEVVNLLKVPPRTIYKYVLNGMLKGKKIAEKWRFSKEQIDAFLKKLEMKEYPRYVK